MPGIGAGEDMTETTRKEIVKGGTITREADTGRMLSVQSRDKVQPRRPKTIEVIEKISTRRSAALERLANR